MNLIEALTCRGLRSVISVGALVLSGSAVAEMKMPTSVWALTGDDTLVNVNPAMPADVKHTVALTGLVSGDEIVGIDYRVARGDMYALANTGRIYMIDTQSGVASLIEGSSPVSYLSGGLYGFDFNPAADKLRVVGAGNLNLRLHPDTGAIIDFDKKTDGLQTDPKLAFDAQDANAGQMPDIVAAAYTYNSDDEKLTTNFAIDRTRDVLVMQGTKEGVKPSVSPNLGVLYTIGALGQGDVIDATMDISDIDNVALGTLTLSNGAAPVLVQFDLATGEATAMGNIGSVSSVKAFAIEP
ncbi:DUF4394 domain-containing protein [Pontibacter sp. JAM-7]|uniref:DUF4394 domain-containing protein n=1 Tax=Pontibacter sp. JAM-7 TaxID=3366581 RepID=UPI003AF92CB6